MDIEQIQKCLDTYEEVYRVHAQREPRIVDGKWTRGGVPIKFQELMVDTVARELIRRGLADDK